MQAAKEPSPRLVKFRRLLLIHAGTIALIATAFPLQAQEDLTTQNASSALNGGWITGPAGKPPSFSNGPNGQSLPYDFPDFHPASSLNGQLPDWLRFEAEERFRFEGYKSGGFQAGNNDDYMLNRFRVKADLRPASWFLFSAQVQDARPVDQNPPYGPPNENRWDLKLAYGEFGNPARHWASLRVGRQLINYNNTLLANPDWRNQGRSFDAAVVNLQKGPFHLGIFAASIVVPLASGISHHRQGNNIYGIYGRFSSIIPHSDLEPFVMWHVQPAVTIEPALSNTKGKQNLWAYGVRWKGEVHQAFEYSVQGVVESGTQGPEPIRAWSTTDGVAYQQIRWWAQPRLFAQYDYASGNSDPSQGVHHTFDAIYSTSRDRFGITDILGGQNLTSVRGGGTINPYLRLSVTAQYLDFYLAQANDAFYGTAGKSYGHGDPVFGRHIGQEGDVYSWYELNRHFNIGAGYAHLAADNFVRHLTGSQAYSTYYFSLNFKDNGQSGATGR